MRQGHLSFTSYLYERQLTNQYWEPAPYKILK